MEASRKAPTGVSKKSKTGSFYRVMKALTPIPYLAKARDFYIRSMSQCAGRANYSGLATGGPGVSAINLPKSFSTSSLGNSDEFSDLARTSAQSSISSPPPQKKEIWRTFSNNPGPSVERIDEEIPCYFGGSFRKIAAHPNPRHSRSRSCRPDRSSRFGENIANCDRRLPPPLTVEDPLLHFKL